MTPTQEFISKLENLKQGELGLFRAHAGQALNESVVGFDLFSGIWWPLRQKNQRSPKRDVAWLVAKLYCSCPMKQSDDDTLARQLSRCKTQKRDRIENNFDALLVLPIDRIETAVRWALTLIAKEKKGVDWIQLTDDLSIWERESTRSKWATQFLFTDHTTQTDGGE